MTAKTRHHSNENWYAMHDLPPGRVHVRVIWAAREFAAVRAMHPETRALSWCTYRNGDIVWLPPKKEADRWGDEPERWQPLDLAKWGMPLPAPIPIQVRPRLYYLKPGSRLADEAEASEIAREMERDREHANASGDTEPVDTRWWRDVNAIRYASRGNVTREMAEGRTLRALAWCGAGKDLTLKSVTTGTILARLADAAEHVTKAYDDRWHGVARFQPLPQDHSDFDTAMAWVAALNPPEVWHSRRKAWRLNRSQRVLLLKAIDAPLSWADITHELGFRSYGKNNWSSAQSAYGKAIDTVHRIANGRKGFPHMTVSDQMAELRARNRSYHREQSGPSA